MNGLSDNILKIAKVIQNNDENCGFRIKARIFSEDDNLSDNELPYAFPLLPKMMHVLPKHYTPNHSNYNVHTLLQQILS